MEQIRYWISEIALLVSGFLYVHTIEHRKEAWKKILVDTAAFLIFCGMINRLPWERGFWVESTLRMPGFLFLARILYVGRNMSRTAAVYYAIWSFISWQLLYEMGTAVGLAGVYLTGGNLSATWIGQITVFVVGYLIIGATIARWMPDGGQKKIGPRQFLSAILIFVIFEILVCISIKKLLHPGYWAALYLTQVLLAVVLYLQNELFKKSDMRQELDMIKMLWKKEQEQYRMSKENIALINQKCHDLKHQIEAIRHLDEGDKERYLEEIEDSIEIYEAIVRTGNEVLDTILTEKSLYCKEHGITISCVADGGQLEFVHTIDLYSILGNAIDNAIEAVEKLKEKEKRQIDVLIYRQQQFVAINVINPIEESLIYEEELPVTTKGNKGYHGYGLKSMKYMLKKYDGFLSIAEKDGCFSLMMLIPIPKRCQVST